MDGKVAVDLGPGEVGVGLLIAGSEQARLITMSNTHKVVFLEYFLSLTNEWLDEYMRFSRFVPDLRNPKTGFIVGGGRLVQPMSSKVPGIITRRSVRSAFGNQAILRYVFLVQ